VSEPARVIATVPELVDAIELSDIVTFELRARRRDGDFDDLAAAQEDGEDERSFEPRLMLSQSDTQLAVRLVAELQTPTIECVVDVAAIYGLREPVTIDEEPLREFLENIAVMTLIPYVRVAFHDLTGRLGDAETLPLVRGGSVTLTDSQLSE
jgi:hypothetical protein